MSGSVQHYKVRVTRFFRSSPVAKAVAVALAVLVSAPVLAAATPVSFDIAAGSAEDSLDQFGKQSGLQIFFVHEAVEGYVTRRLRGRFEPSDGLALMLGDSGLTFDFVNDRTVTIGLQRPNVAADSAAVEGGKQEGKTNSSRDFRLAQVAPGSNPQPPAVAGGGSAASNNTQPLQLDEVVVTAQKRSERLQDVPVPVSVVDTQALTQNNQLRLQDFYSQVPGLSMTTGVLSNEFLSIRGISNQIARGSQTVGILVDDAPFGMNIGVQPTDIDPGDLDHIEVLRGPQGTLYGSSSMGGLLKYVMAVPTTNGFSGRIQAGMDTLYNAAKPGYNVRGSANIPLTDTLAIRLSAFTRAEPGYIDNVQTAQEGINVQRASGGHLAALWNLADGWSLKLNAFYSDSVAYGVNSSDLPTTGDPQTANLTDLQQYRAWGSGYSNTRIQQYSGTLTGRIGNVEIKSITAYNSNRVTTTGDYSTYFGGVGGLADQYFSVAGAIAPQVAPMGALSQEVHLSGSLWSRVDWLAGGFFTHQYGNVYDSIQPEDPLTGVRPSGNLFYENFPQNYREYAGFADLTFHVTDKFDIQVGGRESHINQSYSYYSIGILNGPPADATFIEPRIDSGANAFTYLFTPSYKINADTLAYLRLASGFRAGTLNPAATGAAFGAIPLASDPDKTYNYELGLKTDFLEHRLSLDASIYYIDWKHIQLLVIENVQGLDDSFTTNAGDAKSEGVELSLVARPRAGLTASGWVDYDNAVLKDSFPTTSPFVGNAGDRLPFTSQISAHVSLTQEFPLWAGARGFVGGSIDYLGRRSGNYQVAGVSRQDYPAYAKADLQAGVRYDAWTINGYFNNVTNRRGLLSTGVDFPPPASSVTYISPRLIGINAIWAF